MSLDIELYLEVETGNGIRNMSCFDWNVTHNLAMMADAVGIYQALWRIEETDVETAECLVPILAKGLAMLKNAPEEYKKFNPENGWGSYDHFVPSLEELLAACQDTPLALIRTSR